MQKKAKMMGSLFFRFLGGSKERKKKTGSTQLLGMEGAVVEWVGPIVGLVVGI